MTPNEGAQKATRCMEVTHKIFESPEEQTYLHSEFLNGDAKDLWEACKHAVALLPDIAPNYFAKAEIVLGIRGPGSIRVIHFGPGISIGESVKHQIDKVDNETQTLEYTILSEGLVPSNSSFNAEMKFTTKGNNQTEATWMVKYTHRDEAGLLEDMKKIAILMLKTFECAVSEKRVVRHTKILEAPADTLWDILMHEDVVLPKVIPHIIASYKFLKGRGESGSIRLLKLGHAIPGGKHVVERIDMNDSVTKKWGYTVLQGDPKYKYLSAVMQFLPGPKEGTTTAKWVGIYIPHNNTVSPPDLALHVWKVFESVAKASPEALN